MKKVMTFLATAALTFTLAACNDNTEEQAQQKLEEKIEQGTEGLDEALTLEILQNPHVADAYVQDTNGTAVAHLQFKKDTKEEDKAKVVEQYQSELETKYPDRNINIVTTVAE